MLESPRTYRVNARSRRPLVKFMVDGLHDAGCRVLFVSEPSVAPFRITFETPEGERMGIVAYAFLANSRVTTNRPVDEHRFQLKYGSKDGQLHEIWQDPFGLYTTLLVGIDPERGIFVGADPVLHSPTRMFISIEFKRAHVEQILSRGWYSWERDRAAGDEPVEVLVGGRREYFLRYVRFEREALGEDQGHRGWLADRVAHVPYDAVQGGNPIAALSTPTPRQLHQLAREFELSEAEVLTLIEGAPRLKMAVRGWVAEKHLFQTLRSVPGVTDCEELRIEGGADIQLRYHGRLVTVECKNVLRKRTASGLPRLDFQRTRASKSDPCSRYYGPGDFDMVAACLHSVTDRWEFRYALTRNLDPHARCVGKLASNVCVDDRWTDEPRIVLSEAVAQ